MSSPELSVIVPAFNEEENLARVVEDAARVLAERLGDRPEVIVVDDGSTDRTAAVADALKAAGRCAAVVRHPERRGLGAALRSGYRVASRELIGWLPGDGQFLAEDLLRLLPYTDRWDVVVGRSAAADRRAADGLGRLLLSRIWRFVMWLIVGQPAQNNGLMLFRRKLLQEIPLRSTSGFLNIELPLAAHRREIPVFVAPIDLVPRKRLHGRSKVANLRTTLVVLRDMARFRWATWWSRGRDPETWR